MGFLILRISWNQFEAPIHYFIYPCSLMCNFITYTGIQKKISAGVYHSYEICPCLYIWNFMFRNVSRLIHMKFHITLIMQQMHCRMKFHYKCQCVTTLITKFYANVTCRNFIYSYSLMCNFITCIIIWKYSMRVIFSNIPFQRVHDYPLGLLSEFTHDFCPMPKHMKFHNIRDHTKKFSGSVSGWYTISSVSILRHMKFHITLIF